MASAVKIASVGATEESVAATSKNQIEFSRAAFGGALGALGALGTEAAWVRATPAVDGDVAGKIVVVSRAEGKAAEPPRNCGEMALAAQANGAVGLIAISDGYAGSSTTGDGAVGVTIPAICVAASFELADVPALLAAVAARALLLEAAAAAKAEAWAAAPAMVVISGASGPSASTATVATSWWRAASTAKSRRRTAGSTSPAPAGGGWATPRTRTRARRAVGRGAAQWQVVYDGKEWVEQALQIYVGNSAEVVAEEAEKVLMISPLFAAAAGPDAAGY